MKLPLFFGAMIMSAILHNALAQVPATPFALPAPGRVACVGDSITAGAGADPGRSYPSQLQELLGDKWQVKNFGVSGRTLMRSGDNPYWNEAAFKAAQDFDPNVVIIMLGTNDTKPQNWVHHAEFAPDYRDMVKIFQSLPAKPKIYVCRPCRVPEPGNYGITEAGVRREIPQIDQLARELKLGVIDMHAAVTPKQLPDRVHPNTEGAGAMARAAFQALIGKPSSATPPITK